MATSTQQKQELFKAIWAIAEDLRNSVDGWDFKSYVLGMLFYRFISENITNYVNKMQREAAIVAEYAHRKEIKHCELESETL
ncbi:MAG: type I restriction-modification system subunit M N-terminal domain-containing protein [Muribaculaceae bacterium]|nr:type I restriction-modification system subunit M N-terminal domain-containing protein [Muribaculaceae bacterium]